MSLDYNNLHVIRLYFRRPPLSGGMEKHIATLSAVQRYLGVFVTDVFNRGETTGEAIQVLPAVDLLPIRPTFVRDLVFYLIAGIKLAKTRKEHRPKFVHAHGHWSAAALARVLSLMLKARGTAFTVHGRIKRGRRRWKWALGTNTLVYATGESERRFLADLLGRSVAHLPSAPNDEFFEPVNRSSLGVEVVAVGSLTPVKNYQLLIEVARCMPDIRFAVYGDGPLRSQLELETRSSCLANIEWRGWASASQLREAYASSRVFLSCSTEEGSPTAALEAMACGLPVILTPSNDYSQLLGGTEAGIALSGWGPLEIEQAIRKVLSNRDIWAVRSHAARTIAQAHRWEDKALLITNDMVQAVIGKNI